jgi:Peptidase C39 family
VTRGLSSARLAIGLVLVLPAGARGQAGPATYDCGVSALYALLRVEGRPTDLREVVSRLPQPDSVGHSMRDLRDASRACGLRLNGIRLDKNGDAIDRPMLVFLKRGSHGHFVVIRPVGHTGKLVQVIDSVQGSEVMDKSDLIDSRDWTGLALVPARLGWTSAVASGLAVVTGLSIALGLVRRLLTRRAGGRPETVAIRARG